jgi:hypothetical protein
MRAFLVLLFLSAVAAKTLTFTSEDCSAAGSHGPLTSVVITPSMPPPVLVPTLPRVIVCADPGTTGAPILLAGNGTLDEIVEDGQYSLDVTVAGINVCLPFCVPCFCAVPPRPLPGSTAEHNRSAKQNTSTASLEQSQRLEPPANWQTVGLIAGNLSQSSPSRPEITKSHVFFFYYYSGYGRSI